MKKNMFSGLRDFLLLWGSQTVSALGTAMTDYALVIWVYQQRGTASSITLLTICSFLPTILFRFFAGAITDRWNKKRIMLFADLFAACSSVTVLVLHSCSALHVWHLYIINFLLSFMNAFQIPAAYVATSLLVPQEQYLRVSGLQSFSGAAVSILAPALGSVLLAFGGLTVVLILDLASFAVALVVLLACIKIPEPERVAAAVRESFLRDCMAGLRFLREHGALLRLILVFAAINFLAKLGGDGGMMSAFILGRSGGAQKALGVVETAVALGILTGSALVTVMKPAQNKVRVIFVSCALTFFVGDVMLSFARSLPLWAIAAFASYIPVAILGANLTAVMRTQVPIEMQGRVFSARDTLQNCTIPLGMFLGGVLADHVFEPFMAAASPLQQALAPVFGTGKGSGIAVMFCIVGTIGSIVSVAALRNPLYQTLNHKS